MPTNSKENRWVNYGFRVLFNTASHPFEYAKLLIQIGYEPIPPKPTTTLFGKPGMKLPNIFQYVKHIKSVDGFTGCYNGLAPKLCGGLISTIAVQKISDFMKFDNDEEDEAIEVIDNKTEFQKSLKRDLMMNVTALVVSQPFHVIAIRMMAQFVGRETKYTGIFGSIVEIYKQNGLLGFFAGFIPRLLGDVLSILLANSFAYLINSYIIEEKELHLYTTATTSYVATAITYPFQVVSKCMTVNDSGLAAGAPMMMPYYISWLDCWSDLMKKNQLKRGSSVLIRYYTDGAFSADYKMQALN